MIRKILARKMMYVPKTCIFEKLSCVSCLLSGGRHAQAVTNENKKTKKHSTTDRFTKYPKKVSNIKLPDLKSDNEIIIKSHDK